MTSKALTVAIMRAMQDGRVAPFFEAMADDVTWRWMGTDQWSKTFVGKQAIIDTLFGGQQERLGPSSSIQVHHVHGDVDVVVVEHAGHNVLPDGRRYDNNYCWILSYQEGLIQEVREYMDTQLVTSTFGADPNTA